MKLIQQKTQAIFFANAISGMGGVKFPGIGSAAQYWHNPILENMLNPEPVNEDGLADEKSVGNLLKMFGGELN